MDEWIKITSLEYKGNYVLRLTFSDNCIKEIDMSDLKYLSGDFSILNNEEDFRKVKIVDNGRALKWDCGYDNCADELRYFRDYVFAVGLENSTFEMENETALV
jgi:hypothetical protein